MKYFAGDPVDILRPVLTAEQQALLTDDAAYGDDPVEAILIEYIEGAESFADAYTLARYPTLSLSNAPKAYTHAILTIAKKRLLARREYTTNAVDAEYNESLRWLRDIYLDHADLAPDPNGPSATDSTGAGGEILSGFAWPAPVFGGGFQI